MPLETAKSPQPGKFAGSGSCEGEDIDQGVWAFIPESGSFGDLLLGASVVINSMTSLALGRLHRAAGHSPSVEGFQEVYAALLSMSLYG